MWLVFPDPSHMKKLSACALRSPKQAEAARSTWAKLGCIRQSRDNFITTGHMAVHKQLLLLQASKARFLTPMVEI